MPPERRTLVFTTLILLSGVLLGGMLMNLAEHFWLHEHPANEYDIREHQLVSAELSSRLRLNAEQQKRVDEILQGTVGSYQKLQARLEPQFDAVRETGRDQLRDVLDTNQRIEFDRIVDEVDAKYPLNERPAALATPPCSQLNVGHQ